MLTLMVRKIAVFLAMAGSAFAAAGDCDRTCLKGMLDQYLNAVIKHDPAAAPLFIGFRETDNAVVTRPGTGVWKTVTGLGKMQRRYMDPVTGQAAYFGIVEEGSELAIVTARVQSGEPEDHGGGVVHRSQGRSGIERRGGARAAGGELFRSG